MCTIVKLLKGNLALQLIRKFIYIIYFMTNFIYLHGFASNPQSSKAQFLKQCFEQRGWHLEIPDLNQNDFYNLTLTRQIQQVEALLPESPTTLIGSSFGGLTALWLAERQMQIKRLVLLAPALNFLNRCATLMGESQFEKWRIQGKIAFEHYGYKREELLSYDFIEDIVDKNLNNYLHVNIICV